MDSAFQNALGNFVKNFAYGDAVRHLLKRGYTPERIKMEFHYPLSEEEIARMAKEVNAGVSDDGCDSTP